MEAGIWLDKYSGYRDAVQPKEMLWYGNTRLLGINHYHLIEQKTEFTMWVRASENIPSLFHLLASSVTPHALPTLHQKWGQVRNSICSGRAWGSPQHLSTPPLCSQLAPLIYSLKRTPAAAPLLTHRLKKLVTHFTCSAHVKKGTHSRRWDSCKRHTSTLPLIWNNSRWRDSIGPQLFILKHCSRM